MISKLVFVTVVTVAIFNTFIFSCMINFVQLVIENFVNKFLLIAADLSYRTV